MLLLCNIFNADPKETELTGNAPVVLEGGVASGDSLLEQGDRKRPRLSPTITS